VTDPDRYDGLETEPRLARGFLARRISRSALRAEGSSPGEAWDWSRHSEPAGRPCPERGELSTPASAVLAQERRPFWNLISAAASSRAAPLPSEATLPLRRPGNHRQCREWRTALADEGAGSRAEAGAAAAHRPGLGGCSACRSRPADVESLTMFTAIRRASSLYATLSIENDNDATTTASPLGRRSWATSPDDRRRYPWHP
jgi:hypothetical protein